MSDVFYKEYLCDIENELGLPNYHLDKYSERISNCVWAIVVMKNKLKAAQQSVQLTALWRGLAVSIFINVILLAVVLFTIGGN